VFVPTASYENGRIFLRNLFQKNNALQLFDYSNPYLHSILYKLNLKTQETTRAIVPASFYNLASANHQLLNINLALVAGLTEFHFLHFGNTFSLAANEDYVFI
jgi:hypothetical protein